MEKAAQSISSSWSAYKQRDQTEKAVYKSEITTDQTEKAVYKSELPDIMTWLTNTNPIFGRIHHGKRRTQRAVQF